jgi:hypothetical protein
MSSDLKRIEITHVQTEDGQLRPATADDVIDLYQEALAQQRAEVAALRERVAHLESELRGTLVAGKDGQLHDPQCIGVHGYDCKPWCVSARDALSGSSDWLQKHDAEVRRAATEAAAETVRGYCGCDPDDPTECANCIIAADVLALATTEGGSHG